MGGGLTSFSVNLTGLALGFIGHAMICRALGAEAYGYYAIWISMSLLLVMPAKFGLDMVAMRFASLYIAHRRMGALGALSRFAARVLIISNAAVATFATIAYFSLWDQTLIQSPTGFMLLTVMVLQLSFLGVYSAFFRATRHIFESQAYDKLVRPVLIVGIIATLPLLQVHLTLELAIYITAGATGVALLALAVRFRTVFARQWKHEESDLSDRSRWLNLGWPVLLINAVQQLIAQTPLLLLGSLAGSENAGHYAAAARLAAFVSFGLAALNAISAPMIASAHARNDKQELRRIASVNARLALLTGGAVSIVFILFGRSVLEIFGSSFADAYPALLILLIGGLVNAAAGAVGYFMTMTGNQLAALIIFILGLIISISLCLILIPTYGLIGGAISGAAGVSFVNLAQYVFVLIRIGVDTSALGLKITSRSEAG